MKWKMTRWHRRTQNNCGEKLLMVNCIWSSKNVAAKRVKTPKTMTKLTSGPHPPSWSRWQGPHPGHQSATGSSHHSHPRSICPKLACILFENVQTPHCTAQSDNPPPWLLFTWFVFHAFSFVPLLCDSASLVLSVVFPPSSGLQRLRLSLPLASPEGPIVSSSPVKQYPGR